ncbi:MAG: hypothetical protein WAK17_12375 [Candidatus Nitrosopolaris sp.]
MPDKNPLVLSVKHRVRHWRRNIILSYACRPGTITIEAVAWTDSESSGNDGAEGSEGRIFVGHPNAHVMAKHAGVSSKTHESVTKYARKERRNR